jgi:hypothetical protein
VSGRRPAGPEEPSSGRSTEVLEAADGYERLSTDSPLCKDGMEAVMRIATNSHVNEVQHGAQGVAGPEVLEFALDIESALVDADVLRQSWPEGKMFELEAYSDLNAVPPATVVILANSVGATMIAVRFPHFTFLEEKHATGDAL